MDLDMTPMWDALSDNPLAGPLLVDPIEAINEEGGFYEPDRPVRDWLEEGPIEGIYITPYDPVDPRDCEKWPNSPYCNASETIALEDIRKPLTFDFKPTASKCEVCIELYPRLFGIAMSPGVICFRNDTPQCQVPPDKPEPPYIPPETSPNERFWTGATAPTNFVRVVYAGNILVTQLRSTLPYPVEGNPSSRDWAEVRSRLFDAYGLRITADGRFYVSTKTAAIESGVTRGNFGQTSWDGSSDYFWRFFYGWRLIKAVNELRTNTEKIAITTTNGVVFETVIDTFETNNCLVAWRDLSCPVDNETPYKGVKDLGASLNNSVNNDFTLLFGDSLTFGTDAPVTLPVDLMGFYDADAKCAYRPKPVPQPIPEEDMGCCEETLELLEAIYSRLGVDEFPVKAPVLLTQESEEQADLENHAQLWAWNARNLDALMGQFPIKIKIKDSDPTAEGNQEVELELPNLAETLAELFGLTYQAEMNSDLISEMLLRLIPEVLAAKNAAITGQSYSKANASALGYQGNSKEVEVDYNFDIKNPQSLPQFLRETKGKVTVYQDDSRESVLDILAKLEFAAGIIKAAHYTKPSDKDRLLESIESMIQDEALSIPNKEQWRDWLQRMNRDTGKHNEGQVIQPEIVENVHEGIDRL